MRDIWLAGRWLWCCHRRSDSRHLGPWLRKRSFRVFMENMWRIFGQVEAALFSIRIQQQR
jgi:predicted DCC family thiol-disulfide oxidoreductase YuxK